QMHAPFAAHGFPNILPPSKHNYATFNAVSSAATILFGVLAGEMLRRERAVSRQLAWLAIASVVGFAAGLALAGWVPLVKRIWTASFALYAAGWTCLMLLVFHALTEGLHWRRWAFPFGVAGMNSIALYVSSGILTGPIRNALRPLVTEPGRVLLGIW